MRVGVRWAVAAVALASSGLVYVSQTGSDDPQDECVDRITEHRDEVLTGPASDEQIAAYCRQLLE